MYIKEHDLYLMLGATIRYSLGRQTYMSGFTKDMIIQFAESLKTHQLEQYLKEITEAIESAEKLGGFVGMQIDHMEWKSATSFLKSVLEERSNS